MTHTPRRIGVLHEPSAGQWPARLLASLELAFPVRFERRTPAALSGLDALVALGDPAAGRAAAATGLRTLAYAGVETGGDGAPVPVRVSTDERLARPLRGAVLDDGRMGDPLSGPDREGELLAAADRGALWSRAGALELAAAAPLELAVDESLRDRLQDGRCLALLPLIHLLRELTREIGWQPPAARASIIFDDPNLHWPSYGFVNMGQLLGHAREHGYHLSLATIPLDAWFAHPGAARLVREHPDVFSLVVHGNDHVARELGQPATEQEGVALAAQALRRIEAFERRTRVHVDRVMVPPHEACSEATVRGLLRCGFEGISMTRPYPWLEQPERSWLIRPEGTTSLVGWGPADLICGGFPVLLRHPFVSRSPTELALRALLGPPLIIYGHHEDLAGGLEVLERSVADVNRVADPRWCSLEEIARANCETRREGSLLRLRPFARQLSMSLPAGVERIALELPPGHGAAASERLVLDGREHAFDDDGRSEPLPVAGPEVNVRLRRVDAVASDSLPRSRPRPLALARRVAVEGRDRTLPLLTRARAGRLG
ncbi:MAG TPA: hypothetical protein VI111_07420 [Thermoleophilaceae bacterium]